MLTFETGDSSFELETNLIAIKNIYKSTQVNSQISRSYDQDQDNPLKVKETKKGQKVNFK